MQARMKSVGRAAQIAFGGHRYLVLSCLVVLILSGLGWAQEDTGLTVTTEAAGNVLAPPSTSVAEVIGNDVYIRSGRGTQYYHCGKLFEGDRVQVIKTESGWSCIVPPPGCFSWIAMQYVSVNLNNPTLGVVTGNNVGVYAGSDFTPPMYSISKQVVLNRGDSVRLLSEEEGEYYKIAPPEGAYLWISSQYLRPIETTPTPEPMVEIEPNEPAMSQDTTPEAPATPKTESELLDAYYALSKQIKEELAKPAAEQDYKEIKAKLTELSQNESGGRAARYAKFTLKQVDRYELACTVKKELELQEQELKTVTEQIDEAREARLAKIENLGKFAVIGKLAESSLYASTGPAVAKRYRILDESGTTICYVSPTGAAADKDISELIGHKVGLVGKIIPHQATSRAFIEFSDIAKLD